MPQCNNRPDTNGIYVMPKKILIVLRKNIKYKKMEEVKLFTIFDVEFINEQTGQIVTLTATFGNHKELGKYLTDMNKKSWKMLSVKRKEDQ